MHASYIPVVGIGDPFNFKVHAINHTVDVRRISNTPWNIRVIRWTLLCGLHASDDIKRVDSGMYADGHRWSFRYSSGSGQATPVQTLVSRDWQFSLYQCKNDIILLSNVISLAEKLNSKTLSMGFMGVVWRPLPYHQNMVLSTATTTIVFIFVVCRSNEFVK